MLVAIDARVIGFRRSGVGEYTHQLLKHFSYLDTEIEYVLFLNTSFKNNQFEELTSFFRTKYLSLSSEGKLFNFLKTHGELPVRLFQLRPSLFHSPGPIAPVFKTAPTVLTIHDLSFLKFSDIFTGLQNSYYRAFVPRIARYADRIISVSRNTCQDVIDLLKISEDKIRIVYNGVDIKYFSRSSIKREDLSKKEESLEKYILFLGVLEPRKNICRLIRAYASLPAYLRNNYKLIIAGSEGWLYKDIYSLVRELSLSERVVFTGEVPDNELPALYRGASLFVYPSLMEGFGIPPLEAMACGIPVIASNTSCFPEVLADGALLINPLDEEELSHSMVRVLTDKELSSELVSKGIKRASLFSWEDSARRTLEVYRELLY
ncbi:MAG TPA: glycosyltransferase family 1 protein [Candidatus Eremiobacteraeota bacterium]|nr:glycosyltransferase family 1 protein [Candidatus Eremiobacteraeota bacterium]